MSDKKEYQLTEEELNLDISLDRFNEYHWAVGEDFVDQNESIVDYKVYAGWLLHKYPEKASLILSCLNDTSWYSSVQGFQHRVFCKDEESGGEEDEMDNFYTDFAEFLNLTGAAKRRVNTVLVREDRYYNSERYK